MGASDLRVTVDSAKLRCVLDPRLALGHVLGPRLALGLTRAFEVWLTRSFWRVLDASDWWLDRAPALVTERGWLPDTLALGEWLALRQAMDAGSCPWRYVGDKLCESQLRGVPEVGLVERFEALTAGLVRQAPHRLPGRPAPGEGSLCSLDQADALALSGTLDGALILTTMPPDGPAPEPVGAWRRAGMPACRIKDDGADSLFVAERLVVRQQLAAAGLTPLLQAVGRLAVVHAMPMPGTGPDDETANPWRDAQVWWYPI